MTSELRHDDYAPGGLLELASRCVTAVEQATVSSSTTKAKIVANILRSFAAEKAAMADALVLENSDYAEQIATLTRQRTPDMDGVEHMGEVIERVLIEQFGAGDYVDVPEVRDKYRNAAMALVGAIHPIMIDGAERLATLSDNATQADTDNAALVEELKALKFAPSFIKGVDDYAPLTGRLHARILAALSKGAGHG